MYYLGLVHGLTRLKLVSGHHLHWLDWRYTSTQSHTETHTHTPTHTHPHTHFPSQLCTYMQSTPHTHTHTQPNWKLHELISVPPPPPLTTAHALSPLCWRKSADTLHTCPPRSVPTLLLCPSPLLLETISLVSCPVLLCHWLDRKCRGGEAGV